MSALPAEAPVYAIPSTTTALLQLARSFGRPRQAEPHTAPVLRAAAEFDRDLLPRWHRADKVGHREHAEPAAYSELHAWRSRRHWLDVVVPAAIEARPEALGGVSGATGWTVKESTLREYLAALSLYAHAGTGRRCIVRPDRLAELLGRSLRTVQRCQKAAEALGLYVIITPGRMLTWDERWPLLARGSRQRGLSNEAALVVPAHLDRAVAWAAAPAPEGSCHPSRRSQPAGDSPAVTGSLGSNGAAQGEKGASRLPREKRGRRAYDPEALDLARSLTDHPRHPWLRGTAPGRLEVALRRFARCRVPWTAGDVADAIDAANKRNSRASMTLAIVKNPPALLAKYLRDLDPDADHPRFDLGDPLPERRPERSRIQRENDARRAAHRLRGDNPAPTATQDRPAEVVTLLDEYRRTRDKR